MYSAPGHPLRNGVWKSLKKINQAITKGDSVICVYYYYRADTFCMQPYNTLSGIFRLPHSGAVFCF
ncbi:hypothetical protein ECP03047993_5101 [Escherichia coli P0304799.3]|nr:hypothetical protein ECP03047993_5101 [Escherichia coli P0304799.3]